MVDGDLQGSFNNFQMPDEERCRGGSISGPDFGEQNDSLTDNTLKKVEELKKTGMFKLRGAVQQMMTKAG